MHKVSASHKYPSLTPEVASWMSKVLNNSPLLNNLFEQYGSPINLHHVASFARNYEAYETLLDEYGLRHRIFFARKANKCRAFANEARRLGFGVDTASYRELQQCLELGCDSNRLALTAAVKDERLVRLALNHDVLIILDNEDECQLVNRVAGELGKVAAVGIRISGFHYEGKRLYSRFGFDIEKIRDFITCQLPAEFHHLQFKGFHFHLDGYSIKQRCEALLQTIQQVDALQNQDISTSFIDIGGGLLVNYLSDGTEWQNFWNELKKAVCGERAPITFKNNGLGYSVINDELHGAPDVYPYFNETPKAQFLDEILSYRGEDGESIASLLHRRDIEFRMEPGRSLLDQAGMSIAKVAYRKQDQRGNMLVGLQMNRSQLFSSSADFLLDPIFVPVHEPAAENNPTAIYLTGGYCLEGDIILKRKIMLPQIPAVGDIIAFPNTAGYMMHFYETEAHLFEQATNLIGNCDTSDFIKDANWSNRL